MQRIYNRSEQWTP